MTIKDLFAPGAWRLDGASVRRAAMTLAASTTRRAAMMLLMMMLTTATAWAQDEPEFTPAIQASYQFQANQIKPTFEEVTVYGQTYSWSKVEVSYEKNLHVKDGGTIHVCIPDKETFDVRFAITPAPLTVTAGSATKAYDGTPLTCDTYTVEGLLLNGSRFVGVILTGSQLNVGESDNVPSGGLLTDDNMSDISDYDITYVNGTLTVTPNPDDWEETNTNEYTIKTATGWDIFCDLLEANSKGYFNGKTVKLGANISVTRMAGSDGYEFTGTFDGNGHTLTVSYGSSDSPITEVYAAPFADAWRAQTRGEYGGATLAGLLVQELLIELARAGEETGPVQAVYDGKTVDILRYLNAHLTEPVTIDALAARFFVSKYHMMRRFREETGYSVHSYLANKRLLYARELLAAGAGAMEACFACGYGDYSAFSRAYKKRFGQSPGRRREQAQ